MERRKLLVVIMCVMIVSVGLFTAHASSMNIEKTDKRGSSLLFQRTWVRLIGQGDQDFSCVRQTNDGGYIAVGSTYSGKYEAYLVWLVKADKNGRKIWSKSFGKGTGSAAHIMWNFGYCVQQTNDGGYIIAGMTEYYGPGKSDIWLIKTDSNGDEEWNRTFGGKDYDEEGYWVQQTEDGGYIIVGVVYRDYPDWDIILIKTDINGKEEWNRTFGGNNEDGSYCVQQTVDCGYIVVGYTKSFGQGRSDIWLIKLDSDGNEMWNRTIGSWESEKGRWVEQTRDGGFIVLGTKHFTESIDDRIRDGIATLLIKTDNLGNIVWTKRFGEVEKEMVGRIVHQTWDGGYIIGGHIGEYRCVSRDIWILKTDREGNEEWIRTFKVGACSECKYIKQTDDGGYIIGGFAAFSFCYPGMYPSYEFYALLIKTNGLGKVFAWRPKLFLERLNHGLL